MFAAAVSHAEIPSGVLVFVSTVVFEFPYRLLLRESLRCAVVSVVIPCYYTEALLMWW